MQFNIGSDLDSAHCVALKHEFLRCEDAFKDFEKYGTAMIMRAQQHEKEKTTETIQEKRWIAFKTYNSYARFIHHLYEFLLGVMARERRNTKQIKAEEAGPWMQANAQRVLTGRRTSIINGTAPSWENHISSFPEYVPLDFSAEFRSVRNKANGHVTHERSSKNLSEFYEKYHMFVYMIYFNCLGHWGGHGSKEIPDLKEITEFSLLIKQRPAT
jgi:hypothetical protein